MSVVSLDEILSDYFSDAALLQAWGKVEAILAAKQAALGMIPQDAADKIVKVLREAKVDPQEVLRLKEKIGHPLIPYLRLVEEACGEHRTFLHYGATTDNIMMTSVSVQVRAALSTVNELQCKVLTELSELALLHKRSVMAGRTHTQHALPITFGYKLSGILDEFTRHIERQHVASERGLCVLFGGAIGSFASFGPKGPALQEAIAEELGLEPMQVPLRSINDGWVELAQAYTLAGSTLAKCAIDFKNLCRSELGEIFQDDGSVGSSTMPQKRNPILYNAVLHAFARLESCMQRLINVRVQADDGDSLCGLMQQEDLVDTIRLYYFMLQKMEKIIETLQVNPERMRQNLDLDGAWIMAESVMFGLTEHMGKTEAHDILHDLAMQSRQSGKTLRDAALADERIKELGEERINALLDPMNYIGQSEQLTEKTVQRLREALH